MAHVVLKIAEHPVEERFIIWSTGTDSPITFACTHDQVIAFYEEEARQAAHKEATTALARAHARGTSSMGGSTFATLASINRAGPKESQLTEDEILEFYVRRKEDPTPKALAEYRASKR